MSPGFWHGKRVFVTGHTGFKGSWLCLWLNAMRAEVYGFALEPPTDPSLFAVARVDEAIVDHRLGDIRNSAALTAALVAAKPEIVFHLAAQSLVRDSYQQPVDTYATNVMGTVNLLEALRTTPSVHTVVNVTTDKCYQNNEWPWGYRESESLGGKDPYSSSKACSELVTAAYRASFLQSQGVAVASARAGNVIGGGDWARDRLLPDFLRALDAGEILKIRSPEATRPWQHVLEPLAGYLSLAEHLAEQPDAFAEAWNFGPAEDDTRPVRWIVERLVARMPGAHWTTDEAPQPHEAGALRLDSSKARSRLGWQPRWSLDTALDKTLDWHVARREGTDMQDFSLAQIDSYQLEAGVL
jgi:CDP-glucose 4,6-dehydratase